VHRMALSAKQRAFCEVYCNNGCNGAAAYKTVYGRSNAAAASRLTRVPEIASEIDLRLTLRGVAPKSVSVVLADIMLGDVRRFEPYLRGECSLRELGELGVNTRIVSEAHEWQDSRGRPHRRVKLYSALDAAKALAQVLGMVRQAHDVSMSTTGMDRLDESELKRLAHALGNHDKEPRARVPIDATPGALVQDSAAERKATPPPNPPVSDRESLLDSSEISRHEALSAVESF